VFIFVSGLAVLLTTSCANNPHPDSRRLKTLTYTVSLSSKGQIADFISHDEPQPMKSYLAMNLQFDEFLGMRSELEKQINKQIKHRGEAHITVISPLEFDQILSKKISIQEINKIAEEMQLQKSPFKKICLGKGTSLLEQQSEATYFVVVQSERLFQIRKMIHQLYQSKGGLASDFNPEAFYPHITIGFTKRDLHFEDGVIKDASSCEFNLSENLK
jgi:2'-5' RNA ligase